MFFFCLCVRLRKLLHSTKHALLSICFGVQSPTRCFFVGRGSTFCVCINREESVFWYCSGGDYDSLQFRSYAAVRAFWESEEICHGVNVCVEKGSVRTFVVVCCLFVIVC
jgi:hypothetical protein